MIINQSLENPKKLKIGYLGENDATKIVFNFSCWAREYGDGYMTVLFKRSGDGYAYPVNVTQNGHIATWLVSNIDVAIVGAAMAQVEYRVDNILAKTMIFRVDVENSLDNSGETPEPYESILSQIVEEAHEVEVNTAEVERLTEQVAQDKQTTAGYASDAQGYANDASGFANDAQGYANNASRYATSADGYASDAQGYADDASGYANDARTSAESILDKVGDLTDLDTTVKTDVVSAINEIVGEIGDVESLLSAI